MVGTENKAKTWKEANTLGKSLRESSEKEYGIYVFEPEEIQSFFAWSGWDGGYADNYLATSDFFNSLSDAINAFSRITRIYKNEIQIIARIDGDEIIPLVGRELPDPSTLDVKNIREGWVPYEKFVSENPWF